MKQLKRIIGIIYFNYLFHKGVNIKKLYNKTKIFFTEEQKYGYWKKIGGEWRYIYNDQIY